MSEQPKADPAIMLDKLELVRYAILSLGDAGIEAISIGFASFDAMPDVSIPDDDFKRLLTGNSVKRTEYNGNWHYLAEWKGVRLRAVECANIPIAEIVTV
jgi:hypothetical protein